MASHLLWFRLPKGRVWHVACSGALVALCGQSIPARGERQPKRPPFGARPCPDCDAVSVESTRALSAAIQAHTPRTYGAVPTARQISGTVTLEHVSPEFREAILGRIPTDPEDDGDLPDLLGQDGEVSSA